MEIADITFWNDYVQNHKRVKRKIRKPIKVWKQIPDIVLETLDQFQKIQFSQQPEIT